VRELIAEANRNRDALARAIQAAEGEGDHKGVAQVAKVDLDRVRALGDLAGVTTAHAAGTHHSGPLVTIIMPQITGAARPEPEYIDAEVIVPQSDSKR